MPRQMTFSVLKAAFLKVFSGFQYWVITVIVSFIVLALYYLILIQKTTWGAFLQSNTTWYLWSDIILSLANALLVGIAVSFIFYVVEERRQGSKLTFLHTLGSLFFSTAVTGCSVCSAFLLPTLGIAASLTAFPFGGLEIKLLSVLLLLYALWQYTKSVAGICEISKEKLISFNNQRLELHLSRKTISSLQPLLLLILFIFTVYAIPRLPIKYRAQTQKNETVASSVNLSSAQSGAGEIMTEINPVEGYTINAKFGDIGPKMLAIGVIDLDKFKQVYKQAGRPLTPDQEKILTFGSDQKVVINKSNAYFLLNFFWAFGLANKSQILTEGDMAKNSDGQLGNFASTGGWSLAKGDAMDYYSKEAIASLNTQQEDLVEKVASNIYRPCCGNSTAFPDCNHGMALLGVLELMAANGANENDMYNAAKYINAFWFPENYYQIALYFKNKDGKDYKDVDPRLILSKDISSVFGAQAVKQWLDEHGIADQPPQQGGGCGV